MQLTFLIVSYQRLGESLSDSIDLSNSTTTVDANPFKSYEKCDYHSMRILNELMMSPLPDINLRKSVFP